MQQRLSDFKEVIEVHIDKLPLIFRFIETVKDDDEYAERIFENDKYQSSIVIASPFYKSISGI